MSAFTDEQINEIIGIFTQHMGTRQYVGARYVPIFGRKDETSINWDNTKPYEPLTIVLYQGNSYTSRQYVPSGIDILNTDFWVNTGNYNAQIEQYRAEVETFNNRITENSANVTTINNAIPTNEFTANNTVKNYIDTISENLNDIIGEDFSAQNTISDIVSNNTNSISELNAIIPNSEFSAQHTVKEYIDEATNNIETFANVLPIEDYSTENTVSDAINAVENTLNQYINSDGIDFEYGFTAKDFWTIITIPKDKYKLDIEMVNTPTIPNTIKEFALINKPYIALNITNDKYFIYNGVEYGGGWTQNEHGSIYALKQNSIDFEIFESGTTLTQLVNQGYIKAVPSWNMLIQNGALKAIDEYYSTYTSPNPRQVLAWDENNWYIYTSNARLYNSGKALYGLTVTEIKNFCINRGWPNVAFFDGGGSVFTCAGDPYKQLTPLLDYYYRDCYVCVTFRERA